MRAVRTLALAALFGAVALGITLLLGVVLLGIPRADALAVGELFAVVGGSLGLVAVLAMQPAALGRLGGVRGQLVGASLIGSLLLLGMVLGGAQGMFISKHDLTILLAMLLFASLLAVGLSLLVSAPLANRIAALRRASAQLASGDLGAALPRSGHDEIALLAADFNQMAAALRAARAHEQALEDARRDLVAAVSHDLRTPLAAARALIEAVADGLAADPAAEQRYLAAAQRELAHLTQLVEDLFELAQIDAGVLRVTLERASLHDLLSDTLASFQPQAARSGVRLVGEVAGDIDPVLMNPQKVQRVLHNLLGNALRHTPSAGTILVRAAPRGAVVEVEVRDSGAGIAPADLPHIFERSFRGEPSRTRAPSETSPGAGLGLAIARGLVEAHGGTIKASSEPGQGARFWFTLPRP